MDEHSNHVVLDIKELDPYEIFRWCDEQFGPEDWNWMGRFPSYDYVFYLPDSESITLFRLRWCK